MIEIRETEEFVVWISGLRGRHGRSRILERLLRLSEGYFGDAKPVGNGISEMRFHFGPGYRIYYTRRERDGAIIILLAGSNKSTQTRDIAKTRRLAEQEL